MKNMVSTAFACGFSMFTDLDRTHSPHTAELSQSLYVLPFSFV